MLNGICIVAGSIILICDYIHSQWLREEDTIKQTIMVHPKREEIITTFRKIYSESSLTHTEAMVMAYKQIRHTES
jgi:hypothetical protein